MIRLRFSLLVILAIASISFASQSYLDVYGPVPGLIYQNGSMYLGKVGPGESFYVMASAATVDTSGKLINIGWDTLKAVQLPAGWSAQQSPLYANPMKMKITTSPNSSDGTYRMVLQAENVGNYSKLGNLTFTAYINVSTDVFDVNVTPSSLDLGVGQPGNIYLTIRNTGASDDPFIISAYGLPNLNSTTQKIILHSTTTSSAYPISINEPGVYTLYINVTSTSSSLVHKLYAINTTVSASLLNDYTAASEGAIISPVIFQPAYAIMHLIEVLVSKFIQ